MMENSRKQRAEFHRTVVENQAACRRRLGLGRGKSALVERLTQLLDED